MILQSKRCLFFGAHTDDEVVCAGTLHRLAREGCKVHVCAMGSAGTRQDKYGGDDAWEEVEEEWTAAQELIGASWFDCLRIPAYNLQEKSQQVADAVFALVTRFKPDLVVSLSPDDENPAHAVVGTQVRRVVRGRVPCLLECHYPWNMSFGHPNLFVRLSEEDLRVKQEVIRCYQSQTFRYDYEGILMAQVKVDGLSMKVPAAERFQIVRCVT